jgi:hypothetical protein
LGEAANAIVFRCRNLVSAARHTISGEISAGQTTQLMFSFNEAVNVVGTPNLALNDGETANYDSSSSNPSSRTLVFDYAVLAGDSTPDLPLSIGWHVMWLVILSL